MLDIFTTGQKVRAEIVNGFPQDSIIVRHYYDLLTHTYFLTVQNESFEPVKDGEEIPIENIVVKHLPPEEADYKIGFEVGFKAAVEEKIGYNAGYEAAIEYIATGEKAVPA